MEPKKTAAADLEKMRDTFMLVGISISLAIVFIAFEWRSPDGNFFLQSEILSDNIPEEIIPITRQENPPPPPPLVKQFIVVENDFLIENDKVLIAESEVFEETIIEHAASIDLVADEPEIFIAAEEMPRYPEGEAKMFSYLASNIKYPGIALENGVHGTVYLSFVIDSDGKVKNVKVLKGIGAGCDEEAVRVVEGMPNWIPGKQRNKPVPVQYSLPIQFRLR